MTLKSLVSHFSDKALFSYFDSDYEILFNLSHFFVYDVFSNEVVFDCTSRDALNRFFENLYEE